MKALYPPEAFQHVFDPLKGSRVHLALPWGNVGDQVIWEGTRQLLKHYGIIFTESHPQREETLIEDIAKADLVLWSGGGNMGELYSSVTRVREKIACIAAGQNKPMTIFPQSWTGEDVGSYSKLYAREKYSIDRYAPEAVFSHDLGLGYIPEPLLDTCIYPPRASVGWFFRKDPEATTLPNMPNNHGDPVHACCSYADYIGLASCYAIIHTNRLHFAVGGVMLGRRVFLYPNSYYKNQAIYEASLKHFPNITFMPEYLK